MQTKDAEGTAVFLKYIDESLGKSKEKKEYPMRQSFKRNMSLGEKRLYLLEPFGHETAKSIVNHWKDESIADIVYDTSSQYFCVPRFSKDIVSKRFEELRLQSGRRVGRVKAEEIYSVLFGD